MSEQGHQYQPMFPEMAKIKREIPNIQAPINFNVLCALIYTGLAAGSIGAIGPENVAAISAATIISVPVSLVVALAVAIARNQGQKKVSFGDKIYPQPIDERETN